MELFIKLAIRFIVLFVLIDVVLFLGIAYLKSSILFRILKPVVMVLSRFICFLIRSVNASVAGITEMIQKTFIHEEETTQNEEALQAQIDSMEACTASQED